MTAKAAKKIPAVTTVGNQQIFSSPKATTKPLPAITGPVTVSFKHEDSVGGMAVGPVVVIDSAPHEAWLKVHGSAYTNRRGETHYLIPYGVSPEGLYNLGWVTRHVAGEIAAHYGVALKES